VADGLHPFPVPGGDNPEWPDRRSIDSREFAESVAEGLFDLERREAIPKEFGLKVLVTVIALFGVWKFFADRNAEALARAQSRSLGYIERFGGKDMVDARAELIKFWRKYPEFAAFVRQKKGEITEREYSNFVATTYPVYPGRTEMDNALFRIVFYDEVAYCRTASTCNVEILDSYFCNYVVRHARDYAPFYAQISAEIGSTGLNKEMQAFAANCPVQSRP
jgi:hypothetical protein